MKIKNQVLIYVIVGSTKIRESINLDLFGYQENFGKIERKNKNFGQRRNKLFFL